GNPGVLLVARWQLATPLLSVNHPVSRSLGQGGARPDEAVESLSSLPALVDNVKEMNAHAGRLATVLAFVLTATSFSLTAGPVHDALVAPFDLKNALVYVALIVLASGFTWGAVAAVMALQPAIPREHAETTHAWRDLL